MEKSIVINDVLSFFSCNMNEIDKDELMNIAEEFYPVHFIDDALHLMEDIIPSTKETVDAKDALHSENKVEGLYDCVKYLPQKYTPMFVCGNIDNIPPRDAETYEVEDINDFTEQHKHLEKQIEDLTYAIMDLQNLLDELPLSKKLKLDTNDKANIPDLTSNDLVEIQKVIDAESEGVMSQIKRRKPAEDSKVIVVSPNFEAKENTKTVPFNLHTTPTKVILPDVSTLSHIPKNEAKPDIDPMPMKQTTNLKKPYIIVENSYLEEVGNYLVYRCSLCNFASNDENAVPNHECNIPEMEQPLHQTYTCKFCDFEATNAKILNRHLVLHKKVITRKRFQCVLCYFDCNDDEEFKEHLRGHHWKRPYPCQECDFKSNEQGKLKRHSMWHFEYKGPDHYECHICDKICGSPSALDKHKSMHERNFDHVCSYCGISFHMESKLHTHVLTHTKERSFVCKYCDHATDSLHFLIHHETGHLQEKKLECHICGEIFSQKDSLRFHIQTEHTDVNSHKCLICSEGFTAESDLRMHKKMAHGESQSFVCDYCLRSYKDESFYLEHMEKHKRDKNLIH